MSARRRRLLFIASIVVVAGGAAATMSVLSANGRAAIFCSHVSAGWRVRHRSQFVYTGNVPRPITSRLVQFDGRVVLLWAEVNRVTPSTIAVANRALAGVRTCSA